MAWPRTGALVAALWAVWAPSAAGQAAPARDSLARAVRYLESQGNNRTRTMSATQDIIGIDINSSVRIEVDESRLQQVLSAGPGANPQDAALLERITALKGAVDAIPPLRASLPEALAAWDAAVASGAFDSALAAIARLGDLEERVVAPLDSAIEARLRSAGRSPEQARRETQGIRLRLRAFGSGGYDWERLGQQLALEIGLLNAEMESRKPSGRLEIEIQAHRIGKNGPVAIALPGYNQEETGPVAEFQKIQFAVPEAERDLYQRNATLAASVGATVSFTQALRSSLESELAGQKAAIEAVLSAARDLLSTAGTELRRAADQVEGGRLEMWLDTLPPLLASSPEGRDLVARGREVVALLTDFAPDLDLLERYASLAGTISGLSPAEALAAIARAAGGSSPLALHRVLNPELWRRRATAIEGFVVAARGLREPALRSVLTSPGGPVAALAPAAAKTTAAVSRLVQTGAAAVAWLDDLASSEPVLAAGDLPLPAGQQSASLAEGSADTEFDLQTIRAGREINDRVVVMVRFYRDGIRLPVELSQRFRIQSYGWNARFVASLAWLTRQGSGFAFRAAPAMSWMARYRKWPGGGNPGLGRAPVGGLGVGLTALSLDFLDTEQVELGVAGTLGFLDDRLLVGAGLNLQATDQRFFGFFSIRLFSVSGGIGP